MSKADLVVRGMGTITGIEGEYQLIYDTVLDITWLDCTYPPINKGGAPWNGLLGWADELVVSFGGQIYEDWRLPQALPINGSESDYTIYAEPSSDGSTDWGYNISAPGTVYEGSKASEMAHLYYTTLGNLGYKDIYGNNQADYGLLNTGPFVNLNTLAYYWNANRTPDISYAWAFYVRTGIQDKITVNSELKALAVRPGDVGPVPLPGAVWLLGSGILGIIGIRRKIRL